MINRINQYLSEVEPPEPPPIIQHKDNISALTIFNTGKDEGYRLGYTEGIHSSREWARNSAIVYVVIGISLGIIIGLAL
jgi:hypothetical protein